METFFRFVASPAGRWARVAAGSAILTAGLLWGGKRRGLGALGLLPLATGTFDWCPLAPLVGLPFQGAALRRQLGPAA